MLQEYWVNIGRDNDNWMEALKTITYVEAYFDLEIGQGKWFAGLTKAEAQRIDIYTDNINAKGRRTELLERVQSIMPDWSNWMNDKYFSVGKDLPTWVPDYMEFETYYKTGAIFLEVDFDL